MHFNIQFLLRRTMEEDADTRTTIIVTKLPGSALFFQLCCTGCGARSQAVGKGEEDENQSHENIH